MPGYSFASVASYPETGRTKPGPVLMPPSCLKKPECLKLAGISNRPEMESGNVSRHWIKTLFSRMKTSMNLACGAFLMLSIGYMKCASGSESRVIPLGQYTDMRATESGHCYGYRVTLWQHRHALVGFLSRSESLCEDMPAGLLENVKHESITRKLSFTTRISTGCTFASNRECALSTELIRFNGKLTKAGLAGTATWYGKNGKKIFRKDKLFLKQIRTPTIQHYSDLREWESDLRDTFARTPAR